MLEEFKEETFGCPRCWRIELGRGSWRISAKHIDSFWGETKCIGSWGTIQIFVEFDGCILAYLFFDVHGGKELDEPFSKVGWWFRRLFGEGSPSYLNF